MHFEARRVESVGDQFLFTPHLFWLVVIVCHPFNPHARLCQRCPSATYRQIGLALHSSQVSWLSARCAPFVLATVVCPFQGVSKSQF